MWAVSGVSCFSTDACLKASFTLHLTMKNMRSPKPVAVLARFFCGGAASLHCSARGDSSQLVESAEL